MQADETISVEVRAEVAAQQAKGDRHASVRPLKDHCLALGDDWDAGKFLQALGVDAGSREVNGTLFGTIRLALPEDQGVSLYIGKTTTVTRREETRS